MHMPTVLTLREQTLHAAVPDLDSMKVSAATPRRASDSCAAELELKKCCTQMLKLPGDMPLPTASLANG
jgi:hypothetical protein